MPGTIARAALKADNIPQKSEVGASGQATAGRLVDAVLDLWLEQGRSGISARTISQRAQAPASAINYHFGALEQLLSSSQHAALDAARGWCDAQRATLADATGLDPAMVGPLFAAIVDGWCEDQRRLALAWREGQLLAARNPTFQGVVEAWRALWIDFWRDLLGRFGLARFAEVTAQFFDGETMLHMIRWRRPIDRAALDERAAGWASWLTGGMGGPGPWRALAKAEAEASRPPIAVEGPLTRQLGEAAAELLGRDGPAGVTHRALAAQAGVSLGTVTYHYRTSPELLQAAFDWIYRAVTTDRSAPEPDGSPIAQAVMAQNLASFACGEVMPERILAMDELFVAAARDSSYLGLAALLRYSRGQSSGPNFARVVGVRWQLGGLDSALLSNWTQGLRRDVLARAPADRAGAAAASIATILGLLCEP